MRRDLIPPELRPEPFARPIFEATLSLATPMIGGGSVAGRVDEDCPIRGQEIRGLLRQWWRYTVGVSKASPAEMRAREAQIFGSAAGEQAAASRVKVEVDWVGGEPRASSLKDERSNLPSYAHGVLTGRASDDISVVESGEFKIRIGANGLSDEQVSAIKMASACWILFGGLGMRTRRGFGSLELKEGQSPDLRRIAALVTQQPKFSGGMYSLLGARIFVGSEAASAKKAWQEAVEQYRDIKLKRKLPTHTNSRLASPVITKAVQDKGRWKPLILVLANSKSGLAEAYASELRSAPYKELRGT